MIWGYGIPMTKLHPHIPTLSGTSYANYILQPQRSTNKILWKFYSAGKMHKKAHQQLPGALKILTRCAPSKEAMNDDSWFYPWQIPTPLGPRFLQKRKSSLNNIHSQIYFLTENKSMISPTPQPSWSKKKRKPTETQFLRVVPRVERRHLRLLRRSTATAVDRRHLGRGLHAFLGMLQLFQKCRVNGD